MEFKKLEIELEELKGVKKDSELLVPFGAGIFLRASLKDNQEVLVNVGSDVAVKKSVSDSKELIEKQISELEDIFSQVEAQTTMLVENMQKLQEEFEELAS